VKSESPRPSRLTRPVRDAERRGQSELPRLARFHYPDTIEVRPQPTRAQGVVRIIELAPGTRGPHWEGVSPARPLRDYTIALTSFSPDDRTIALAFGDVEDQAAWEAANLSRQDSVLIKSPNGGVWRTRIEERLSTRALPGRGRFAIAAVYRLGPTETLSEPIRR
jgi:hypothetical protein